MENFIVCACGCRFAVPEDGNASNAGCPSCGIAASLCKPIQNAATQPQADSESASELEFRDEDVGKNAFRPLYTLFSPWLVGVAGLLGGVLGGSIALGLNYRKAKRTHASNVVIVLGILATFVVVFTLPLFVEIPIGLEAIVPLSAAIGLQMLAGGIISVLAAVLLQRRAIAYHRKEARQAVPVAGLIRISLASAVLVFGLEILWLYPFSWGGVPPTRTFNYRQGQRLTYSVGFSRETIRNVAKVLNKRGLLRDDIPHRFDALFLQQEGYVESRFFVLEEAWAMDARAPMDLPLFHPARKLQPLALRDFFKELHQDLLDGPFRGQEVRVVICSTFGKTLEVFR